MLMIKYRILQCHHLDYKSVRLGDTTLDERDMAGLTEYDFVMRLIIFHGHDQEKYF